jgi:prevent-host-death family protein
MRSIRLSEDVVPLGEFKARASSILRSLSDKHRPLLITQNGQAAGVLLSPTEYDALCERDAFLEDVVMGLADAESGRVMSVPEVREKLAEYRKNR